MKKMHLERRRRADISEKLDNMHSLTVSITGRRGNGDLPVDKVEILDNCIRVLEQFSNVALRQRPELLTKLRKLLSSNVSRFQTPPSPTAVGSNSPSTSPCESGVLSDVQATTQSTEDSGLYSCEPTHAILDSSCTSIPGSVDASVMLLRHKSAFKPVVPQSSGNNYYYRCLWGGAMHYGHVEVDWRPGANGRGHHTHQEVSSNLQSPPNTQPVPSDSSAEEMPLDLSCRRRPICRKGFA